MKKSEVRGKWKENKTRDAAERGKQKRRYVLNKTQDEESLEEIKEFVFEEHPNEFRH